jgi:hypothetical protein
MQLTGKLCLILLVFLGVAPAFAQKTDFTIEDRQLLKDLSLRTVKIETRLDEMEKHDDDRFDAIQKQMDYLGNLILVLIGSIIAAIAGMVGFVIWDRQATNKPVLSRLERLEKVVNQYAAKHEDLSEILKQTA